MTPLEAHNQGQLWELVAGALRVAADGVWSPLLQQHIATLAEHIANHGPLGRASAPWPLEAGGIYDAILDLAGVEPTEPMAAEVDSMMTRYGHQDRLYWTARMAGTVEKIQEMKVEA